MLVGGGDHLSWTSISGEGSGVTPSQFHATETSFPQVSWIQIDFNLSTLRQQIAYWETYDGSQIRELEGSTRGSIDGMDLSTDGLNFVTGGDDKEVVVCDVFFLPPIEIESFSCG